MTKNRQTLRGHNSPITSPRRCSSSVRKKALKRLSGKVQFGAASKANLKVVVRVRPQNQREKDKGSRCVVKVLDEHMLVFDPKEDDGDGFFFKGVKQRGRDLNKRQPLEKKFAFEHVFGEESTNVQLYEATAHPLIETLLQGYNCCVFAYGATGAGKTFTMLGRPECPGITSLTLQELYQRLDDLKSERRCEVAISYLEVYNETVRDLLGSGKPLALQEIGQQVMVPGLSLHKPNSAEELLEMLAQGNNNRTQHATDANAESSRSHAVFQIFVRQQDIEPSAKTSVTISKLSMIDLAGSERGAATGYKGMRFKEGSSINKSLLALGNCINALADGQRHIPYRDSKLTRLLKDSLGGNCRSVMIAAMSSASVSFEDTYNTLRYADRAKTIRTTIRNNVKKVEQHVSDYIKIVAGLKEEVSSLREKLKEYEQKEEERKACGDEVMATPTSRQSLTTLNHQEEMLSEEEGEAQRKLMDASAEQKALRQELLQLEAAYKTTELKRNHWFARLARVKVVAFASAKLDKTISKCERTIHTLDTYLLKIDESIQTVKGKIVTNQANMEEIQEVLKKFAVEPDNFSKHSRDLVENHRTSIILRDSYQFGDYLQTLLKENFKEQYTSEQLIHVLLGAVRDLYIKLYQNDQRCPEVCKIFQHVVNNLDECRIVWADQQSVTEEENDDTIASAGQSKVTHLSADHYASLPSLLTKIISPTIAVEPTASFRKSNMMTSLGTSLLNSQSSKECGIINAGSQTRSASPSTTCIENNRLNLTATLSSPMLSNNAMQLLEKRCGESADVSESSILQQGNPCNNVVATSVITSTDNTLKSSYVPSASHLSSLPLNTTIDISTYQSSKTPSKPTSTSNQLVSTHPIDIPSQAERMPNRTIDLNSPKLSSICTTTTPVHQHPIPITERFSGSHSDIKLLPPSLRVSNSTGFQFTASSPGVLFSSTVNSTNTTITTTTVPTTTTTDLSTGPAVARKLFAAEKPDFNSTFSIAECDNTKDCATHLSVSTERDHPRSPGRSPLFPLKNRANHCNPPVSIVGKQSMRAPFITNFRGRKSTSRTPYKSFGNLITPRKSLEKESGMRRSISTPSLIMQQSSARKLETSTKKLKGFGGTLHRTTSFLRGKTTNQENVPPLFSARRPAGMARTASPSSQRCPGPVNKT